MFKIRYLNFCYTNKFPVILGIFPCSLLSITLYCFEFMMELYLFCLWFSKLLGLSMCSSRVLVTSFVPCTDYVIFLFINFFACYRHAQLLNVLLFDTFISNPSRFDNFYKFFCNLCMKAVLILSCYFQKSIFFVKLRNFSTQILEDQIYISLSKF